MKHPTRLACLALASLAFTAHAAETASATVTLAGGANAGTHHVSVEKAGCSTGLTGRNSFGAQISNPKDKDPKKLNSVQLDVPDKSKANEFTMTVGFGPLIGRTASYTIDTRNKKGSGSLALADNGNTASAKVSGTTADGVKLEVAIDCKTVMRMAK
jgi:hypothetical protein